MSAAPSHDPRRFSLVVDPSDPGCVLITIRQVRTGQPPATYEGAAAQDRLQRFCAAYLDGAGLLAHAAAARILTSADPKVPTQERLAALLDVAASKARALVEDLAGPRLPAVPPLPSAAELAAERMRFLPRRARCSLRRLALALMVASNLMLLLELIVLASAAWPVLYARYPAVLTAWVLASSGMAALAIVCIVIARSRERTAKEVA